MLRDLATASVHRFSAVFWSFSLDVLRNRAVLQILHIRVPKLPGCFLGLEERPGACFSLIVVILAEEGDGRKERKEKGRSGGRNLLILGSHSLLELRDLAQRGN